MINQSSDGSRDRSLAVITVRMKSALHERLQADAKAAGKSMNQYCVQRLFGDINPQNQAENNRWLSHFIHQWTEHEKSGHALLNHLQILPPECGFFQRRWELVQRAIAKLLSSDGSNAAALEALSFAVASVWPVIDQPPACNHH